jgi:hypothetical protein
MYSLRKLTSGKIVQVYVEVQVEVHVRQCLNRGDPRGRLVLDPAAVVCLPLLTP